MAIFQRDSRNRSCVSCPTCSYEIPVASAPPLRGEFSVPCPNCGQRKMYRPAEVRDPRQDAQAIVVSRTIPFATGRKMPPRPQSWLNAWLHSR